ncbi:MAG: hypothetical protein ACREH5_08245, partial [Candidatus Omnitrophota bacterium]
TEDCSLTPIKKIAPPHVWKKLAKSYLMEGKITGEEYLNLTSDHPMKIMGLEDITLYLKSVQNYAELADKREEILEYLKTISAALAKLKRKLYPRELVSYEDKKKNSGAGEFEARFRDLTELAQDKNIDLSVYPDLLKLIELQLQEKLIDFNLANMEQASLIEEVAKKGGEEDLKAHLQKRERMKGFKASQYAYFQKTFDLAREKGVLLSKYPHLSRYGEYLRSFSEIDLDLVLDELSQAEDKVYLELLGSEDPRLVRAIDRFLALLHTAYQIQMSTKEFNLFKANEPDFATVPYLAFINRKLADLGYFEDLIPYKKLLEEGKESLEAFYDSVTRRDFAFTQNTERILREEGQKVAVLITGGYHTPHLKKLFREKGYSVAVLTPVVTSETNQQKYEKLLLSPIKPEVKRVEITGGERRADRSLSALDRDLARKKREGVRAALARAMDSGKAESVVTLEPEERAILQRFTGSKERALREIVTKAINAELTDRGIRGEKADAELAKRTKEYMDLLTQGARLAVQKLTTARFTTQVQAQMQALMGRKGEMSEEQRDDVVAVLERAGNTSLLYYSKEGELIGFVVASANAAVKVQGKSKTGTVIILERYQNDTVRSALLNQMYKEVSKQAPAADVY